jgi:hypothetical protein
MNGLTSQAPAQAAARIAPGSQAEEAGSPAHDPADPAAWLAETDSPLGRLRYALPPVGYDGSPSDWSRPPGAPGADPAAWW